MSSSGLTRRSLLLASGALCLGGRAVAAEAPTLEVAGRIQPGGAIQRFTIDQIEALGVTTFSTATPWYPEPCSFSGVLLSRFVAAVHAEGDTARFTALNDYTADVPVSDFAAYGPILATRRDGRRMPVSDKGPLFVIYPFDSLETLRHQSFYSRSVWQVNRVDFV